MFLPSPIACDICKTVKQPSNHWFYADAYQVGAKTLGAGFNLWPWDSRAEDSTEKTQFVHLCEQACAVKKLAEWMNQQKQEPQTEGLVNHDSDQGGC